MFDRQKLDRLRARYGEAGGNEIFDPHFRATADSVFKNCDKRPPPYAGVPTLSHAPFRPDSAPPRGTRPSHIDAHCGTSGSFEGCKLHHGGPFRQAVLDGVLDPERTSQIGIRGNADYLGAFSYDSG